MAAGVDREALPRHGRARCSPRNFSHRLRGVRRASDRRGANARLGRRRSKRRRSMSPVKRSGIPSSSFPREANRSTRLRPRWDVTAPRCGPSRCASSARSVRREALHARATRNRARHGIRRPHGAADARHGCAAAPRRRWRVDRARSPRRGLAPPLCSRRRASSAARARVSRGLRACAGGGAVMPSRNGWNAQKAARWIKGRHRARLCLRCERDPGGGRICAVCRRAMRKRKHCGYCGCAGHNILTCAIRERRRA